VGCREGYPERRVRAEIALVRRPIELDQDLVDLLEELHRPAKRAARELIVLELYRQGRLPVDRLRSAEHQLEAINAGFDRLARGDAVRDLVVFG